MGVQKFEQPSVGNSGNNDADVNNAIDAAITVANSLQFNYDASDSKNGRVIVRALWKGKLVTMTMRFFKRENKLTIATALNQPGDVFLSKGGQKLESLYYSRLRNEITRRGLVLYGDLRARP